DRFALYVLRPGHAPRLAPVGGWRRALMGAPACARRGAVSGGWVAWPRARLHQAEVHWHAVRIRPPRGGGPECIPLPEPATEFRRVALRTGVTLNVGLAGDPADPAVILLHGFPESHRTWRELAPRLEHGLYLVMPDQRGFAASDRPQEVGAYKTNILVDDLF